MKVNQENRLDNEIKGLKPALEIGSKNIISSI
jgi:hypothetical protein